MYVRDRHARKSLPYARKSLPYVDLVHKDSEFDSAVYIGNPKQISRAKDSTRLQKYGPLRSLKLIKKFMGLFMLSKICQLNHVVLAGFFA